MNTSHYNMFFRKETLFMNTKTIRIENWTDAFYTVGMDDATRHPPSDNIGLRTDCSSQTESNVLVLSLSKHYQMHELWQVRIADIIMHNPDHHWQIGFGADFDDTKNETLMRIIKLALRRSLHRIVTSIDTFSVFPNFADEILRCHPDDTLILTGSPTELAIKIPPNWIGSLPNWPDDTPCECYPPIETMVQLDQILGSSGLSYVKASYPDKTDYELKNISILSVILGRKNATNIYPKSVSKETVFAYAILPGLISAAGIMTQSALTDIANSAPSGKNWFISGLEDLESDSEIKSPAIHAEMDLLISELKKHGTITFDTMLVTHLPCQECMKHMYALGIRRVFYVKEYKRTKFHNCLADCLPDFRIQQIFKE